MLRRLAPFAIALGLLTAAPAGWGRVGGDTGTHLQCASLGRLMSHFLQRHLEHESMTTSLRERAARTYLERIDPQRTLFLAPEAEAAVASLTPALNEVQAGSCGALLALHAEVTQRLAGEEAFVRRLVGRDDFAVDPNAKLVLDPDKRGWPSDPASRDELLRVLTDFQVANYLNGGVSLEEARKRIAHRYELRASRWRDQAHPEIYEGFLDSFAQSLDPHSDYFSADELEDFQIDMQLSLEGIGVSLSERDGYAVVEQIIPGGAADRVSALQPKDRIIAVAEENGEFIDVIDMRLREIVRLIRGKAGSTVRLSVLRQGEKSERLEVAIVRDKIDLEQQAAKLRLEKRDVDGRTLTLAVLDLPSFYGDQDPRKRQGSHDVARLLAQAREAGADGLLLDLSRNGGGLLDDAVRISGFFIREGGIVAVGSDGASRPHMDPDRGILWSGPMVVLISRVSASASEILAGALKDYGRAVIVGDDHTFGKGTVQSVVQLPPGLGALKVTTALYFRPSGNSTQNDGVRADVVVPSPFNLDSFGEGNHPNALPSASIPPFIGGRANGGGSGERWVRVAPEVVKELRARSQARQEQDERFRTLRDALAARAKDDGVVTLSEILDAGKDGEVADTDATGPVGVASSDVEADGDGDTDARPGTPQLDEALRVLGDLVVLETPLSAESPS